MITNHRIYLLSQEDAVEASLNYIASLYGPNSANRVSSNVLSDVVSVYIITREI